MMSKVGRAYTERESTPSPPQLRCWKQSRRGGLMADTDVGKTVFRHNDHGEDVPATIIEYRAGKDTGDHYVFGGTTPKEQSEGAGTTFSAWLQHGTGELKGKAGTFSFK